MSIYLFGSIGNKATNNIDADILIYGCNVASEPRACPKVRLLINSLSHSASRLKPTENNLTIEQSSKERSTGVFHPYRTVGLTEKTCTAFNLKLIPTIDTTLLISRAVRNRRKKLE